jgi:hypothetical protein
VLRLEPKAHINIMRTGDLNRLTRFNERVWPFAAAGNGRQREQSGEHETAG